MKKFLKPAGHKCGVSSTVYDAISFGTGELDDNGFWEHGCYECARAWEKQFPASGECWPHSRLTIMRWKWGSRILKVQRFIHNVKKYCFGV